MAAVAAHFPLEVAVPSALAAGVDGMLVCHRPEVQHRAIDLAREAVERGSVSPDRLAEARARIGRLLAWAAPPPDVAVAAAGLRSPEALALAARLPSLVAGRDPTAA
jgi:beta-N-acetylhexosaminidase